MKKNNILSVLALAAMVTPAASCSNDENVVENKKKIQTTIHPEV